MQIFFLAPTRQNVGLTSVALGVALSLQHQGLRVGFVKPVSQNDIGIECSTQFARQILKIESPTPYTNNQVAARISSGQNDELLEGIVSLCMNAAQGTDVLVVEGLHTDPHYTFSTKLNTDMVRGLHAEVILVSSAHAHNVVDEVKHTASQFKINGCHVAGVVFNKIAESFNSELASKALETLPVWGTIKFDPVLLAPRALDVARYLNAEVVVEGEIAKRRVTEVFVTARSVSEVVPRLKAGALVVSTGDRSDVMLATALAASHGIELAGLLLTHSSFISTQIQALASKAFNGKLPILRTHMDTFETVSQISRIATAVPADDCIRMNMVLDTISEQINTKTLMAAVKVPPSTCLSPPAFRYQLIQKARATQKRIVLPEGEEPRTIRAAIICTEKGIAQCILLGKRAVIETITAAQGMLIPKGLVTIDPDDIREKYVDPMVKLRKNKGLLPNSAREQMQDEVVLGTMMLAMGDVDGLVSGAIHTTSNTVRPALQLIKTAPGSSIVSSVFFMLMPDQVLVYGDCAINPDPTAEQLAEIALQSADSAKAFGIEPRIAMISYSTGSSGSGVDVDKVREATQIARQRAPDLLIDGPMQYDAASNLEVGQQKAPGSQVAGRATVFIFPDLNTGNTTYKAVQRSANVVSVGPMLQGLRKPVNDLSRGALVDDIVFTIALTAIQAGQNK